MGKGKESNPINVSANTSANTQPTNHQQTTNTLADTPPMLVDALVGLDSLPSPICVWLQLVI